MEAVHYPREQGAFSVPLPLDMLLIPDLGRFGGLPDV